MSEVPQYLGSHVNHSVEEAVAVSSRVESHTRHPAPYTLMYICIYVYTYSYIYMFIYIYIYLYIYIYIYTYIYIYIFIYMYRERRSHLGSNVNHSVEEAVAVPGRLRDQELRVLLFPAGGGDSG